MNTTQHDHHRAETLPMASTGSARSRVHPADPSRRPASWSTPALAVGLVAASFLAVASAQGLVPRGGADGLAGSAADLAPVAGGPIVHERRSRSTAADPDAPAAPAAPDQPRAITLPKEPVRYLTVDNDGAVWFRFAEAQGSDLGVAAIDARGARSDYVDLRAAVEARYDILRRGSSLADFWAVDGGERVWVGPAFFDGRRWTERAPTAVGEQSDTAFDMRVLVDADGTAWVPYRIQGECQASIACEQFGLMGFDSSGTVAGSVTVDAPPEIAAHTLDVVRLAPGVPSAASAPRALYRFPGPEPVLHSVAAGPGETATGYATAFAAAPDESPEVYLAVERVPRGAVSVVRAIVALRRSGPAWVATDLTACPLFQGERGRTAIVVAAAYGPAGELWLASSEGAMALRSGEGWLHFNSRNSPLGAPIRDIDVGPDGKLWVGTTDGTRTYFNGEWASSGDFKNPGLYVPIAVQRMAIP